MVKLDKLHILKDATLELTTTSSTDESCTIIDWKVKNSSNKRFQGTISIQTDIPQYFIKPWIMIPAYLYGEDEASQAGSISGKIYPVLDSSQKIPAHMRSSWWTTPADRTSSPIVYMHENNRAFALAGDPHVKFHGEISSDDPEPQISIGFTPIDESRIVQVVVPACEEPFTHNNTTKNGATIRRLTMEANSSVSGRIRIYEIEGKRHSYQNIIEHYYNEMKKLYQPANLPEIHSLVDDAIHGIVEGHYHKKGNYFIYSMSYDPLPEQIANANNVSLEWHNMMTGFVNGFPICHALLKGAALNNNTYAREVAIKVADKFCIEGISPSGLFWADWTPKTIETENGSFENPLSKDREEWGSGWLKEKTWVHSRTIADACDNLATMILLEEEREPTANYLASWKSALKSNLDVALELQLNNGSYGQYYDAVNKKIVKEDGCGGLLWIPALIKARKIFVNDENFIKLIDKSLPLAAEAYAEYVERELIWGAPEDNNSPTSEDGLNAVMAYCDLYELFNDERYLKLATIAADWMLTFRKTYNEILPEKSLMGVYNMKSMGGDFASVSNGHLHVFEALCTKHLCKLSKWTNNNYYRDRAAEHWTFICQLLSRCDGMYNGFRGAMGEQFYWADWGSWEEWHPPSNHTQKGNMGAFSTIWCIAVILLVADDAKCEF